MSTLHGAPAAQTPNPTLRPSSLPYRYPGSASEARYYCSTILVPAPGRPPSSFRPPLLQGCSPFDPPRQQGSLPALWWLAPGRALTYVVLHHGHRIGAWVRLSALGSRLCFLSAWCQARAGGLEMADIITPYKYVLSRE